MKYLRDPAALIIAGVIAALASGQAVAKPLEVASANGTTVADDSKPVPKAVTEVRYREGRLLERRGDLPAAVEAYRDAGQNGDGMAQRKLGDIYGTGKGAVARDYETSLRWYRRMQDQGIEIPNKPFVYSGVRRQP